jgi:hypothetical protein
VRSVSSCVIRELNCWREMLSILELLQLPLLHYYTATYLRGDVIHPLLVMIFIVVCLANSTAVLSLPLLLLAF